MSDQEDKSTTPVGPASDDQEQQQWITLMAGHVERLGLQEGLHDYVRQLRGGRDEP